MGHRISEWEAAIQDRSDIKFTELYLSDGVVRTAIGVVLQPYAHKTNRFRTRRVRWDSAGNCICVNGQPKDTLQIYNITFN